MILDNYLWFQKRDDDSVFINDIAVRIRAGLMLIVPIYLGLTLYEILLLPQWVPDGSTATDTFETDWDGNIIYAIEAVKRTYEYSTQTTVLFYALFEMLAGMFVFTSRFSPTIYLSTFLARNKKPVWKPLVPKRYAWTIGATLISTCLVFFNPDSFAEWVNTLTNLELLPTTENYMPFWIPQTLVFVCLSFMWLETVLGFCAGCTVYALLVKLGIHEEECEACNNIDWEEQAKKANNNS